MSFSTFRLAGKYSYDDYSDYDDYDDYRTPDTSRINEASFTGPATAEATSTLRLKQKVERDRLTSLFRHLNVTGNLDLIDFNRFEITTDHKKGAWQ